MHDNEMLQNEDESKKGLPEGGQLRYLIRMFLFFQLSCCKNKSLAIDDASNLSVIKWFNVLYWAKNNMLVFFFFPIFLPRVTKKVRVWI